MNFRLNDYLIRPIQTEKSNDLKDGVNQLVFEVKPKANKLNIRTAIEKAFNVKVSSVNTMMVPAKKKRAIVGRRRAEFKKANWKKAIVTLQEGHKIDLFEGV